MSNGPKKPSSSKNSAATRRKASTLVEDQVAFQEAGIQSVLFSDTGYQRMQSIRTKFDNAYEIDYTEMARRVQAFSEVTLRYAGAE